MTTLPPLSSDILPPGIRARRLDAINGLTMHVLEAGFEPRAGRCCCCCTASRKSLFPGAR